MKMIVSKKGLIGSSMLFLSLFSVVGTYASEEAVSLTPAMMLDLELGKRAEIEDYARNLSRASKEDKTKNLRELLKNDYVKKNLEYMPRILNSLLEAGVDLEPYRKRVKEVLGRWQLPGGTKKGVPMGWEHELIFAFWPTSDLSREQQKTRSARKALVKKLLEKE